MNFSEIIVQKRKQKDGSVVYQLFHPFPYRLIEIFLLVYYGAYLHAKVTVEFADPACFVIEEEVVGKSIFFF